jgi:hypothetical protein
LDNALSVASDAPAITGKAELTGVSVESPPQVSLPAAAVQTAISPRLVSGYFWSNTWLPSE